MGLRHSHGKSKGLAPLVAVPFSPTQCYVFVLRVSATSDYSPLAVFTTIASLSTPRAGGGCRRARAEPAAWPGCALLHRRETGQHAQASADAKMAAALADKKQL